MFILMPLDYHVSPTQSFLSMPRTNQAPTIYTNPHLSMPYCKAKQCVIKMVYLPVRLSIHPPILLSIPNSSFQLLAIDCFSPRQIFLQRPSVRFEWAISHLHVINVNLKSLTRKSILFSFQEFRYRKVIVQHYHYHYDNRHVVAAIVVVMFLYFC